MEFTAQPPHWNLDQLYVPDSPALAAGLEKLDTLTQGFARWREVLKDPLSADDFAKLIGELEELTNLAHRISGYASLRFAQDTQDQKAQSFMAAIDEKMANLGNELLFFEIWWKELDAQEADRLAQTRPDFNYWLERTRAFKPNTLPEAQEKVINLKDITGKDALIALYDSITNRYRFKSDFLPANMRPENNGDFTREELMVYARHHDPRIRQGAYRELYRVYGQDGPILGQMYQTRARDWRIENITLRHYPSPAAVRHKYNGLSPEIVDSLLAVCRRNAPVFSDFFALKAKVLGLEKFRRYDLYAPLKTTQETFGYDQACQAVVGAFDSFDAKFSGLAQKVFQDNCISASIKPGKQGGAFCASICPGDTPWVLMSFNGRRQDLFTLAHELGHAVHSQLAAHHHVFHFHATLPLAETASTFAEMVLAGHMGKSLTDKESKADLLFHMLDDAYATVGRQAFFALFEITAHEMIENGATVDELAQAYQENLRNQFSDGVMVPDEFKWEWVSIPHFYHTPFYVYAYSFGQLLVYSLWRQYQQQGPAFAPRLLSLLAKGGSGAPEDILKESGLGPLDEKFWEGGFEVIKDMIAELKAILN